MCAEALRKLDITDLERIERYRRAGYGGSVSDALFFFGIDNTVLAEKFKPLKREQVLAGRAITVKLHSFPVDAKNLTEHLQWMDDYDKEYGFKQKLMMRTVDAEPDGSILCFDCGGDLRMAQFGEMSCQTAYAHGCRGMLMAGNCRDTRYVMQMADFPVFSFGTRPNGFGGILIEEVNVPIFLPGHLNYFVRVNPGDFIFGDSDGAQVIPRDYVDEVLLRVEETFEKENAERTELASGIPIDEVYRKFGIL